MNTQPNLKEDDQANELRNLFHELEQHNVEEKSTEPERDEQEIDVLNLPPRKVVHAGNKRMKWKPSKPFLRLLGILVIIIICLVVTFYVMEGDFTSILHRL